MTRAAPSQNRPSWIGASAALPDVPGGNPRQAPEDPEYLRPPAHELAAFTSCLVCVDARRDRSVCRWTRRGTITAWSLPRRIALVTGASSGIGAATAKRFAAEGFLLHCAARRTDPIEALADEIGGVATACDVTDRESVAALAERVGPDAARAGEQRQRVVHAEHRRSRQIPQAGARSYAINVLGRCRVAAQALLSTPLGPAATASSSTWAW